MADELDPISTVPEEPVVVEEPVPEPVPPPRVDKKSKVIVWYPQSNEPKLSVNDGPFVTLPYRSSQTVIEVETIFPLKLVFKNEFKTYKKTFDYYEPIDATSISILRHREVTNAPKPGP